MNNIVWKLFFKTGDIETYLLLKHIENEQLRDLIHMNSEHHVTATVQSEM